MRWEMWLGLLPLQGCFVITDEDLSRHDLLEGTWEGTWESEIGEGDLLFELRGDWTGEIEIDGEWVPCEIDGTRVGNDLSMLLAGESDVLLFPFEMQLEAKLTRTDRVSGEGTIDVGPSENDCVFDLERR